jgi:hypothetical protein
MYENDIVKIHNIIVKHIFKAVNKLIDDIFDNIIDYLQLTIMLQIY